MKTATHAMLSLVGAIAVGAVAWRLDRWALPSRPSYSSADLGNYWFLWRTTLSRIALAVPIGILCWAVLRQRPSIFVGLIYVSVPIGILLWWLVVPPNSSIDVFRRFNAFDLTYANVCASLVCTSAIGIAAILRCIATSSSSNQAIQQSAPRSDA